MADVVVIIVKVMLTFLIIGILPFIAAACYMENTSYYRCPLLYNIASAFAEIYLFVLLAIIVGVIISFFMAIVVFLWTI